MSKMKAHIKLVALIALSVYVLLFVVVNLTEVKVKFIFMTLEMPMALVILFGLILGALGYFGWTKVRHLIKQAKGAPTTAGSGAASVSPAEAHKPGGTGEPASKK
jgi:uncharacterized integral membrane protein